MLNVFRAMVVVNLAAGIALTVVPDSAWSDGRFADLLKYDGYGAQLLLVHPVYQSLPLIASVVAAIGLAFFQNWGRLLFLVLWLIYLFGSLVFGVRVAPPIANFVSIIESTLSGAILALAFFGPLSGAFSQRQPLHQSASSL